MIQYYKKESRFRHIMAQYLIFKVYISFLMLGRGTNVKTYAITTSAAATAFLLLAPMLAFADSPHFISASSGLSGANLTCTFREAGLGNLGFSNIKETCSANATAVYECVNGGGKIGRAHV